MIRFGKLAQGVDSLRCDLGPHLPDRASSTGTVCPARAPSWTGMSDLRPFGCSL